MGNNQSSIIRITDNNDLNELITEAIKLEEEVDDLFEADIDTNGSIPKPRAPYLNRKRLIWYPHVQTCLYDGSWRSKNRMSFKTFSTLVDTLRPSLTRNPLKCRRGTPIIAELIVAVGVRFLAGELLRSMEDIFKLSKAETYNCRNRFILSVLDTEVLQMQLPQNADEWEKVRKGFERKSTNQLFRGVCGAVDGFFQGTTKPKLRECKNPLAFRSGHYKMYGLNCQAACSANLKFIYFGVVAPGGCGDNVAIDRATSLKNAILNLPLGCYFVGDAAYALLERLLVPFTGNQRNNPDHDAFNFFLSQMRIRIEMAFGRLTNKWRILRRKLDCSMPTNSKIIMSCAILHNFVIDHDGLHSSHDPVEHTTDDYIIRNAPNGMQYLPTIPEGFIEIQGVSCVRESIVSEIQQLEIRRPLQNLVHDQDGIDDVAIEYYSPN